MKNTKYILWGGGLVVLVLLVILIFRSAATPGKSATSPAIGTASQNPAALPGGTASQNPAATPGGSQTSASESTPTLISLDSVLLVKKSPTNTAYLTDPSGRALYFYSKDTPGWSTCTGNCAVTWPPYIFPRGQNVSLPAGLTFIPRPAGLSQLALNGRALYYYSGDKNPDDTTGDGVGGVWHLATQ